MKTKISMKPIVKWLRELSVVVTGIALTFGIGFLVNTKNNKEDLKQYLNALKMEMEQNAEEFDYQAQMFNKSVRYADYLKSINYTSPDKDSLAYYAVSAFSDNLDADGVGFGYMLISHPISSMTNAFEMFKVSGAMRQMKDKELLMIIWRTYTEMELAKSGVLDNYKVKEEEAIKEMQLKVDGIPIDVPMKRFYSTDLPQSMKRKCMNTAIMLKETISELEKAL